jgi:predicted PurR-regulated permease PerM
MQSKKSQLHFLLIILVLVILLVFAVLRPFIVVLALAIIFATVLSPVYQWFLRKLGDRRGLASALTILLLTIFLLTPLVALGVQIFQEAQNLYLSINTEAGPQVISNLVSTYFPKVDILSTDVSEYVQKALSFVISHLGGIFSGVASFMANLVLFLIALYYLLRDGHLLRSAVLKISPMADRDDSFVLDKLATAVNSVVRGGLLVAIIQGFLCSVGFAIFGVPNPFLWGSLAAIAALIPGVGTALVLIPAILYLFATSHTGPAIGLLIWGMVAVGLVDNLLGPKLLGRGAKIHPLLILLSVLGGLAYFGPTGFLLGPLVMSLLFALFDIYFSQVKDEHN